MAHFLLAHTHTQTFYSSVGFVRRWASTRRNIHPFTAIMVISHHLPASSMYCNPWHPPYSVYVPGSLFSPSPQVFFDLPLRLAPLTSYSIHFLSLYQKGKTSLDFTKARDSEWQWHQLGHMQIYTSPQTDNHASTPPLSFLQAGCPSCRQPTVSKHWRTQHVT